MSQKSVGLNILEGVMIMTTSNAIGKPKIKEDMVVITINLVVSIKSSEHRNPITEDLYSSTKITLVKILNNIHVSKGVVNFQSFSTSNSQTGMTAYSVLLEIFKTFIRPLALLVFKFFLFSGCFF